MKQGIVGMRLINTSYVNQLPHLSTNENSSGDSLYLLSRSLITMSGA